MPPKSDRFLKPRGVCLAKVTDGGWPSVKHGTEGLRLIGGRRSKQGHVGPMSPRLDLSRPYVRLC